MDMTKSRTGIRRRVRFISYLRKLDKNLKLKESERQINTDEANLKR